MMYCRIWKSATAGDMISSFSSSWTSSPSPCAHAMEADRQIRMPTRVRPERPIFRRGTRPSVGSEIALHRDAAPEPLFVSFRENSTDVQYQRGQQSVNEFRVSSRFACTFYRLRS